MSGMYSFLNAFGLGDRRDSNESESTVGSTEGDHGGGQQMAQSGFAGRDRDKVVAAVSVPSAQDVSSRGFCPDCRFVVKLYDHQYRCKPVVAPVINLKELAWVGDAAWTFFVRQQLVNKGCGRSQVLKYVTNEVLCGFYWSVLKRLDLHAATASQSSPVGLSLGSQATYVEAAYAVSTACRFVVALGFDEFDDCTDSLLRSVVSLDLANYPAIRPQPAIDGYCYLALVPENFWTEKSKLLGAYPLWLDIKQHLLPGRMVRVWYWVGAGHCHLSLVELPGFIQFVGFVADLPLDDAVRVGGTARYDLTRRLLRHALANGWPADITGAYYQLLLGIRRFQLDGRCVMTTTRNWVQLQGLFAAEAVPTEILRSALFRACNALEAALQLIHVDTIYIKTTGVITVVSQLEAATVDPVGVIA